MLHSCHRLLVVSASACVLRRVLPRLVLLLVVTVLSPCLLRAPHAAIVGIKPSSVALFCVLLVLGCYPVARVLLELTWMFPGSLLRYREKFQAAVLTQFAMLCTHLLYC